MTVLHSGGAKNGKSDLAQELAVRLAHGGPLYYVATMIACDEEDHRRIQKHLASRDGMGFETIECGRNILSCLERVDNSGTFLLDSTTALLMNELFPDPAGCEMDLDAANRCARELAVFAQSVGNAVMVSDGIYADCGLYDKGTEAFRRGLAHIDRTLAQVCQTVIEVAAGHQILHKGVLPV